MRVIEVVAGLMLGALGNHTPSAVFNGDSLTAGAGATAEQYKMPYSASNNYNPKRWYYSSATGGFTSSQILAAYAALPTAWRVYSQVNWMGRNNYSSQAQVLSDVAAITAYQAQGKFIVLSVINGDYPSEYCGQSGYLEIQSLNAALSTAYGAKYLDVWTPLIALGSPSGAYPDPVSYANCVPPSACRSDAIHLNDTCYPIIGQWVRTKLDQLGY